MTEIFNAPTLGGASALTMRRVLRMVYMWMTLGLLTTAGVAVYVVNSPALMQSILRGNTFMILILVELAVVLAFTFLLNRVSVTVAGLMFFAYAALNGVTFSVIFLVYDLGLIYTAFFVTAGTFAAVSVLGYTTELDLTQYRSYFFMGLIGLLIALVVNMFLRNSTFDLLISMFGVVLFTALTAYDTQKIKRMASSMEVEADSSLAMKASLYGALQLYLDFVNLFLYILRLLGRRR